MTFRTCVLLIFSMLSGAVLAHPAAAKIAKGRHAVSQPPHAAAASSASTRQQGIQPLLAAGWRHYRQRSYASAQRLFGKAMMIEPDNSEPYYGLALTYQKQDRDLRAAEVFFRIALAKEGASADTYIDYARLLASEQRFDDGLLHLYKTLDRWPHASNARSNIAVIYYEKRNFIKACEWAMNAQRNNDALQPGLLENACR